MGHSRPLFFSFRLFCKQSKVNMFNKSRRWLDLNQGSLGIGSDRSANCATTTDQHYIIYWQWYLGPRFLKYDCAAI